MLRYTTTTQVVFSPPTTNLQFVRPPQANGIPLLIYNASEGRPMLRLRNIHPDLNGMDLNDLFMNVAPVNFVKFDPRNETVAYVCFQDDYAENNARAIARYDGKKAMGNVLTVENATSLADRIMPQNNLISRDANRVLAQAGERPRRGGRDSMGEELQRPREQHRERARAKRERKPRPAPKTAEDLDNELAAYMNEGHGADAEPEQPAPAFSAQDNGEAMMD